LNDTEKVDSIIIIIIIVVRDFDESFIVSEESGLREGDADTIITDSRNNHVLVGEAGGVTEGRCVTKKELFIVRVGGRGVFFRVGEEKCCGVGSTVRSRCLFDEDNTSFIFTITITTIQCNQVLKSKLQSHDGSGS